MKPSISFFLLFLPSAVGGRPPLGPTPKMIAEEVSPDKPNLFNSDKDGRSKTITSNNAIYLGDCSPTSPFRFPVGSRSSRGAVGVHCGVADSVAVGSDERKLRMEGPPEPNFWALDYDRVHPDQEDFCGVTIVVAGGGAGTAAVSCREDTPVVVFLRDDDASTGRPTPRGRRPPLAAAVEADVSCGQRGEQLLELKGEAAARSRASLEGQTRARQGGGQGRARGPTVDFKDASSTVITIQRIQEVGARDDGDAGMSLIQATLDDGGGTVYRTFIAEAKSCWTSARRRLRPVGIRSSSINGDGDVEIDFDLDELLADRPAGDDARLRVEARIGISAQASGHLEEGDSEAAGTAADVVHRTVDMSAFLSRDHPVMVVHGGWIRRALSSADAPRSGWDVVVEEAVVSDPEANYRVVARMEDVHATGVGSDRSRRRAQISEPPSREESEISDEMRQGRRPEPQNHRRLGRSFRHMKILIHGYCGGGSPFPMAHFADDDGSAIAFVDPEPPHPNRNWSNDEFAKRIFNFAERNAIKGCAAIAHSQGGLASLHLYTHYWSCLDYSERGGSRRIQSVGSPYQGTIAITLGLLSFLFDEGCGYVEDLTPWGAPTWLSGIPAEKRGEVNFHTTSYFDDGAWWTPHYCSQLASLVLAHPDDGTVEQWRGQLSFGINRGHVTGQCHGDGMHEDNIAQYKDSGRNSVMNITARY